MKKNNKGFTLVELIVVIAILGVLMAVLVPQYIQYVEKSRVGVDNSYIGEVGHACEVQCALTEGAATQTFSIAFAKETGVYTITGGAAASALQTAVEDVVPPTEFKSNTYKEAAPGALTLTNGVLSGLPAAS